MNGSWDDAGTVCSGRQFQSPTVQ